MHPRYKRKQHAKTFRTPAHETSAPDHGRRAACSVQQDDGVLRVLCSTSELDEGGETLTVGDMVTRLAARNQGQYFGTDLDDIDWHFDRYAEYTGRDTATIAGQIVAIAAIYLRLTATTDTGWTARSGSAHVEPLESTSTTRRPVPTIDWRLAAAPTADTRGFSAVGYRRNKEGDEHLAGWVITLTLAATDSPT